MADTVSISYRINANGLTIGNEVARMTPLKQALEYIRSLDHDGCQNELEQISHALFTSNGKVIHDNIRNDKIVRERYDEEKHRFTEQMFSYVSNGQMIPVELVNSLCRFMYQSHRHCFPGFMGFNRVNDRKHITRWLDDMKHPEEACVHACYVIRKYINGKGATDIMLGNLSKGFQHYGRAKDPNQRIWSLIETMFINSIHQYYWTMESKMHDPF